MSLTSLLGSSDLEHIVANIEVSTFVYSRADMIGNVLSVPVKPGCIILGVGHEVTTVFAGGATPTVNIGDGVTPTKYATSAEVVPGTKDTLCFKIAARKYPVAGAIVVTAHADVTSGAGKLYIFTVDLNGNGRIPSI
jgi:hypothetical protein